MTISPHQNIHFIFIDVLKITLEKIALALLFDVVSQI